MKPNVVVDIGNSRMKWGICTESAVGKCGSLSLQEPAAWQLDVDSQLPSQPSSWAVAGVHPERRDQLIECLRKRGHTVLSLESYRQLPLEVFVAAPDRVGIDRLLNAVAANDRVKREAPKIIIDAGSAVTVDLVDASGAFQGGAIFPGFRLMAQALHDHTALLPLVRMGNKPSYPPGVSTESAIEAGIYWAVAGGVRALVRQLLALETSNPHRKVFLTGGDARLLAPVMDTDVIVWPEMTLEGIRLAAEALP